MTAVNALVRRQVAKGSEAAEVLLPAAARASAAELMRAERLAGPDSKTGSAMPREFGTCTREFRAQCSGGKCFPPGCRPGELLFVLFVCLALRVR